MKIRRIIRGSGWLIVKNSIYGMAGAVFGQAVAMLTSVVMGRLLGVQGVGTYSFAVTFAAIAYMFLNLGLGGIFQRNIARDLRVAEKLYSNALALRILFSIPMSFIVAITVSVLLRRTDDLLMLLLACFYTGLTGVFSLIGEGITAIERFSVSFWYNCIQKILIFISTFITLYFTRSMTIMLIFHNLVFIILIFTELFYVNRNLCKVHLELDISFCKELIRESAPTILGAAAEYVSLKSDLLVISILIGDVANGLYSISSNIYIAASFIPLAMAKAATPTFNRMYANKECVYGIVKNTFKWMLVASVLLIVGIFVLGKWGITILWGSEFEMAAESLKILSVSLLFMPFNRFFEYLLVGLNKQRIVARYTAWGAIFNVIANVLLVPVLGMNAVAITTIVTECIVMVMELKVLRKAKLLESGE